MRGDRLIAAVPAPVAPPWAPRPRARTQQGRCRYEDAQRLFFVAFSLLLLVAAGLPVVQGREEAAGKQPQQAQGASACVLPVYLVKDECQRAATGLTARCFVWENRYLLDVVLAQLPEDCGCRVQLIDRSHAVSAMHAMARQWQQQRESGMDAAAGSLLTTTVVLVARGGLNQVEKQAVRNLTAFAKQNLVVVHLGDEKIMKPHDVLWYPDVRAVFRNYHQDLPSLLQHTQYLTQALPDGERPPDLNASAWWAATVTPEHRQALAGGNVHWIPLGFGENFMTSEVWRTPLRARELLWSWVGSTHRKWERIEMVGELSAEAELLKHGLLHELDGFKSNQMWSPLRYSDLLHSSVLVPVPQGVACEQFRLYEAVAAGAIPVMASAHQGSCLAHVPLLGLRAVWVRSWREARGRMLQVLGNATLRAELEQWQLHNWQRYRQVMALVGRQFARVTCGAAEG